MLAMKYYRFSKESGQGQGQQGHSSFFYQKHNNNNKPSFSSSSSLRQ
jgi:hypothetical protein